MCSTADLKGKGKEEVPILGGPSHYPINKSRQDVYLVQKFRRGANGTYLAVLNIYFYLFLNAKNSRPGQPVSNRSQRIQSKSI